MSKLGAILSMLTVLLVVLIPTRAALAAGSPTDPIIYVSECVLTVEFDAQSWGNYTVNIWDNGVIVQSASSGWVIPGTTLVFEFLITEYAALSAPGVAVEIVKADHTLYSGQVGEIEPLCNASLARGCQPDLTAGAVVGRLVDNTFTYWSPSRDTRTDAVLTVGTSWWVLGRDSSGEFYQVVVSCQPVWVPASVLGPNFDEVWNGRPLPTDIVK